MLAKKIDTKQLYISAYCYQSPPVIDLLVVSQESIICGELQYCGNYFVLLLILRIFSSLQSSVPVRLGYD